MESYFKRTSQTPIEKSLSEKASAFINGEKVTLNQLRDRKAKTKLPISPENLRILLIGKPISLKLQVVLIEFFGYTSSLEMNESQASH